MAENNNKPMRSAFSISPSNASHNVVREPSMRKTASYLSSPTASWIRHSPRDSPPNRRAASSYISPASSAARLRTSSRDTQAKSQKSAASYLSQPTRLRFRGTADDANHEKSPKRSAYMSPPSASQLRKVVRDSSDKLRKSVSPSQFRNVVHDSAKKLRKTSSYLSPPSGSQLRSVVRNSSNKLRQTASYLSPPSASQLRDVVRTSSDRLLKTASNSSDKLRKAASHLSPPRLSQVRNAVGDASARLRKSMSVASPKRQMQTRDANSNRNAPDAYDDDKEATMSFRGSSDRRRRQKRDNSYNVFSHEEGVLDLMDAMDYRLVLGDLSPDYPGYSYDFRDDDLSWSALIGDDSKEFGDDTASPKKDDEFDWKALDKSYDRLMSRHHRVTPPSVALRPSRRNSSSKIHASIGSSSDSESGDSSRSSRSSSSSSSSSCSSSGSSSSSRSSSSRNSRRSHRSHGSRAGRSSPRMNRNAPRTSTDVTNSTGRYDDDFLWFGADDEKRALFKNRSQQNSMRDPLQLRASNRDDDSAVLDHEKKYAGSGRWGSLRMKQFAKDDSHVPIDFGLRQREKLGHFTQSPSNKESHGDDEQSTPRGGWELKKKSHGDDEQSTPGGGWERLRKKQFAKDDSYISKDHASSHRGKLRDLIQSMSYEKPHGDDAVSSRYEEKKEEGSGWEKLRKSKDDFRARNSGMSKREQIRDIVESASHKDSLNDDDKSSSDASSLRI